MRNDKLSSSSPFINPSSGHSIEVHGLFRNFGSDGQPGLLRKLTKLWRSGAESPMRHALQDVNIAVRHSTIFGLLGPNGSGKSTLMKILSTLLLPTSGTVRVCGLDVVSEAAQVRRHIGVLLAGDRTLYWKLTGRENLLLFAALNNVGRKETPKRVYELLEMVGLDQRANELVETYSTGMRVRLGIARALLADPPVLILDEPTSALDPLASKQIREMLVALKNTGKSILIATHRMEEADQVCDSVAILSHGRVIATGAPAQLKRHLSNCVVMDIHITSSQTNIVSDFSALPGIKEVHSIRESTSEHGSRITIVAEQSPAIIDEVWSICKFKEVDVRQFNVREPSLEEVFLELTESCTVPQPKSTPTQMN